MRLPSGLLLMGAAILSAGATLPLQAQRPAQPRNCVIDVDTAGRVYQTPSPAGGVYMYAGGIFRAHCRDQATTMVSDSVEWYSERGELHLIGNVHFRDSTSLLDGDRVTYYTRTERLYAQGNVYSKSLASGSEMRGPNLDYYRVAPNIRDTVQLIATGRPTIYFVPSSDSMRADTANPFVITADRTMMRHTDRMWGSGRVVIDRRGLHATADSAMLDLGDSVGHLIGAPRIVGRDTTPLPNSRPGTPRYDTTMTYQLTGQRIRFDLGANQSVRRVLSFGDADALGPDWHLTSDTLDMALDSGRIQRAQAWGDERRPVAVSGLSRIDADSLDIQMPGQVMRLVWAYGRARATSKPDSAVTEDDWLSGDSLRADFAEATDSLGRRRSEISRVSAFGTARAYYHTDNEQDPQGERGINYSRGDRINIAMAERKVRTVDIVGEVDGIYLEPLPAGWDTLQVDSSAAPAGRAEPGQARPSSPAPQAPPPAAPRPVPAPVTPRPGRTE